jgi:hypothetical protein
MRANTEFQNRGLDFWAHVKVLSEKLSYSKNGEIKKHTIADINSILTSLELKCNQHMIQDVQKYLVFRADILNNQVSNLLIDIDEAEEIFDHYMNLYYKNRLTCKLPRNKQKGKKSGYAYYTGVINIITEMVIRDFALERGMLYGKDIGFDDDPRSLTYIELDNRLIAVLSRRYDGALPSTINPLAIWEIKEYYNTTTFGSRIADGVYETQLDGFELQEIKKVHGFKPQHIYFIDSKRTWWLMGKSYLCRIIDMLHQGLVDEVFFGKEVLDNWPARLSEILQNGYRENVKF